MYDCSLILYAFCTMFLIINGKKIDVKFAVICDILLSRNYETLKHILE